MLLLLCAQCPTFTVAVGHGERWDREGLLATDGNCRSPLDRSFQIETKRCRIRPARTPCFVQVSQAVVPVKKETTKTGKGQGPGRPKKERPAAAVLVCGACGFFRGDRLE